MPAGEVESWPRAALRLLLVAAAVDAVLALGVLALGWTLGWSTRPEFANGFVWTGLLTMALGGLLVGGGWASRPITLGFAASAGPASLEERVRATARDTFTGYRRFVLLFLAAAPLVLLGVWLDPRL